MGRTRIDLADQIDPVCLAQFLLFRQGQILMEDAREKGVMMIGDLLPGRDPLRNNARLFSRVWFDATCCCCVSSRFSRTR